MKCVAVVAALAPLAAAQTTSTTEKPVIAHLEWAGADTDLSKMASWQVCLLTSW